MRMSVLGSLLACVMALSACDIKLQNRAEWECLESEKFNFKDPDSVEFVANLGSRGKPTDQKENFWVRYKAKNSYGAYGQENMACSRDVMSRKFARDKMEESLAILEAQIKYLQMSNVSRRAGGEGISESEQARLVEELVYKSAKNIY